MSPARLILVGLALSLGTCWAQPVLEPEFRMNGKHLSGLFPEAQKQMQQSVVDIVHESQAVVLGTVVNANGIILTKASELPKEFTVRFDSGHELPPIGTFIDRRNDLALIQVSTNNLIPLAWTSSTHIDRGSWVSAPTVNQKLQVGICSAQRREIKRIGGVMGIMMSQQSDHGVAIQKVVPSSGANTAGLQPEDVITHINDKPVVKRQEVLDAVKAFDAGEVIRLKILRGEETLDVEVTLGHRSVVFEMFNRNQMMSGTTSKRRSGFKEVIQHDLFMEAASMGGPLMGIDGKAVGYNIAKANRVEIFSYTSEFIQGWLAEHLSDIKKPVAP